MAKLQLAIFDFWEIGARIADPKSFHEEIDIRIGIEGERKVADYSFIAISTELLAKELSEANENYYLHYYIVLKSYDKDVIKAHIENLIQQANELCESNSDAFKYLNRHLKPEAEEWLY